ncbi:hypothetical protein [Pseudomonas sp. TSRC2-2]|uniref:hypothetical protein n=1 Tax=unclassified Pseudomonas TaxID=196821 RepID=UPI003CF39D28
MSPQTMEMARKAKFKISDEAHWHGVLKMADSAPDLYSGRMTGTLAKQLHAVWTMI